MKIYFAEPPTLNVLDHYDVGVIMTLDEYRSCVENGCFINYDGFGELLKDGKGTDLITHPSELNDTVFPDWCTHIIWYNK